METEVGENSGNWLLIAALAASAAAAWLILSKNVSMYKQMGDLRGSSGEVSPVGSLKGWLAGGKGVWAPVGDDHRVVVFQLSAPGTQGDARFWQEIARESEKGNNLKFQFVGMCARNMACDSVAAEEAGITLVEAMDPLQLRSLAIASREGRALVYLGSDLQATLRIGDGTRAIVDELVRLVERKSGQKASAQVL